MVSISLYRSVSAVILMTEYISNAAAVGTTIVNENKTWADANAHCRDNFPNGRLASSREIMDLYNGGSPSLSDLPEYVWVADNRILTQWIRYAGCYNRTTITTFITMQNILTGNRPGLCQQYCARNSFFALQNVTCYCLNDGFSGGPADRMSCGACTTQGDVNIECGGQLAVNVYETVSIDVKSDVCNPNVACNCVLAQCTADGNVLEYFNTACSTSHDTICDDGQSPDGPASNWNNKFIRCRIKQTYFLSDFADINMYICVAKATSQYWIGIFRAEVKIDFYVSPSPMECSRIQNTSAGPALLDTTDCGEQYQFICIHTDTDNSETTKPERVSSAQSTMDSTQTTTTLETTIQKPNDQTNLGTVLGPVAAVIVVIVLVVVLITKGRKNKQRKLASMKKEVHDSQEVPNNQIASSMRDESHYDVTYDESEAGGFRGNNASHSKLKKAAEVEENAYDVTNRFNRKESAAESHYDHMCPQPNEGAIYNTVDRSVKSGDIMSENVYDHAVKQDNDIYDRAIRSQQLQNVHITENTYAHADLG